MDEARRFIRYIFPGLLFIIELSLFFYVFKPTCFLDFIKKHILGTGIGPGISVLVVSAGIGYFCSIIHHSLYWRIHCRFPPIRGYRFVTDHRETIERARNQRHIILHSEQGPTDEPLTVAGAWRVLTAFWYEYIVIKEELEKANQRTDSLADLTHGAGSALIACLLSIILFFTWPIWSARQEWTLSFIVPGVVALVLLTVHICNYLMMTKHSERIVDIIFTNELYSLYKETRVPLRGNVDNADLEKNRENLKKKLQRLISSFKKHRRPRNNP